MSDWLNVPKDINPYAGFVYLITNLKDNKKYIGKKFFFCKITRKPLKGKKRKRHSIGESDWKNYWGSSVKLLIDFDTHGEGNFKREILECFVSRWECAYYEVKYQIEHMALFREDYYNGIMNCRIPKAPIKLRI